MARSWEDGFGVVVDHKLSPESNDVPVYLTIRRSAFEFKYIRPYLVILLLVDPPGKM